VITGNINSAHAVTANDHV